MKPYGIMVLGHRRPKHLQSVLESLKRQGVVADSHVWIDGFSHSAEIIPQVKACRALQSDYPEAHWHLGNGRCGVEKLMLDGLSVMARSFDKIIVLEDDCFPTADAIRTFLACLDEVEADASLFSVYGHHFQTPGEGSIFPRFQGWGWATVRTKLLPVLAQLKTMFMLPEEEYLAWARSVLTPDVVARLDLTPGRDVVSVLSNQFSWDSATALLTAMAGLSHMKTPARVVYNCGLGPGSGHFQKDSDRLRQPPFNLVAVEEVWDFFEAPEQGGVRYYGLDELDKKLEIHIPQAEGIFVEVGAYDGINQSNTLHFENKGWRGVLIEPVPESFRKCKQNRPLALVINAACVAKDYASDRVSLTDVGLMSIVDGTRGEDQDEWIRRGEEIQHLRSSPCTAPARTLSEIIDEAGLQAIDLLSVDVEGYELQVLDGLDFSRHRPRFILAEDSAVGNIPAALESRGYELVACLSQRRFTRDLLFRDAATSQAPRGAN